MKKKIAAELTSLAHDVLQIKNKDDVHELLKVARLLHEKLSVMAYVETYFEDVKPTAGIAVFEDKLRQGFDEIDSPNDMDNEKVEKIIEEAKESAEAAFSSNDLSDLFVPVDQDKREEIELPGSTTIHQMVEEMPEVKERIEQDKKETPQPDKKVEHKKELENPTSKQEQTHAAAPKEKSENKKISVEDLDFIPDTKKYMKNDMDEITADFANMPEFERKVNDQSEKPLSLNERLKAGLKIGMNDRIGFIKHLFNGSDQDFNRVLSQLNTMESKEDAFEFIQTMVKPDYNNWEGKGAFEERFIEIVEGKFS